MDISSQAIEEFTEDQGSEAEGAIPGKYEEEKQPDVEDPHFVNNMIK